MLHITVLTENRETDGLESEHGLSFYVEFNGKKYLLDAGQSAVFYRNAQKLGIELREVETAVLSHAHYDHADGFEAFFQVNEKAKVYACAQGREMDCYSLRNGCMHQEKIKYIGISPEILMRYGDRFCWTDGMMELDRNVWLVPHSTQGLEKIGARTGMYRMRKSMESCRKGSSEEAIGKAEQIQSMEKLFIKEGQMQRAERGEAAVDADIENQELLDMYQPDSFSHEQSLVFEAEGGLVIFNSCSHGGVMNIVSEVRAAFPGKQIMAYIGGFHLKAPGTDALNCTEEEAEALGRSLLTLGVQQIYTGHCTGAAGYEILKQVMGDDLHRLYPGQSMILK